jgi:predicted Mrr-cat superfamily restriction endonuclease
VESRQDISRNLERAYPADTAMQRAIATGQVYRFLKDIAKGDYVLTPIKATRTVLIGRVEGDYSFQPDLFSDEYPHTRSVTWLAELSRDDFSAPARNTLGGLSTVFNADAHFRPSMRKSGPRQTRSFATSWRSCQAMSSSSSSAPS